MANSQHSPMMSVNMRTSVITTEAIKKDKVSTVMITNINIMEDSIETVQDHKASSKDSTKETKA